MAASANRGPLTVAALRAQTDERLVVLFREGHEPAFEEIVRRYRPTLVDAASRIAPGGMADDAVQDVLTRAHDALRESQDEISLRPWLSTSVRNRSVSLRRKQRPSEPLEETIDGVTQPLEIAERGEQLRAVVAGLKGLPDGQREALVRTALGGESSEEIATRLGTSPAGVSQLVFRARTSLRNGEMGITAR